MSAAVRMVRDLCDRWPVYFGNGNHEQRIALYPETYGDMHARWCKAIRHPNLHLLRNQHTVIRKDGAYINIYGLELNRTCSENVSGKSADEEMVSYGAAGYL